MIMLTIQACDVILTMLATVPSADKCFKMLWIPGAVFRTLLNCCVFCCLVAEGISCMALFYIPLAWQ